MRFASLLLCVPVACSLTACGIDADKISTAALVGDDGDRLEDSRLRIAVIGRTVNELGGVDDEAFSTLLADLRASSEAKRLDGLLLTGGYVARSSTRDWSAFAERWSPIVQNEIIVDGERLPVWPVPGAGERLGDKMLAGFGAAFEGIGADIGFGRVASWSHVDAEVGENGRWRFVFLDTHAERMGSRWEEQRFWLPGVVTGGDFDHLVVVLPDPAVTLADGGSAREDRAAELLAIVDTHADVMKLKAVISGGPRVNEALLPTGQYGELHLTAGAGTGAPGVLTRAKPVADSDEPLTLAPLLDDALRVQAEALMSKREVSDGVRAQVNGDDGEQARFPPASMPTVAWWLMEVQGPNLRLTLRTQGADGLVADRWIATWAGANGWKMSQP